ncbi:hypothetical protein [Scatolibacter rhodanostii]|uniref:hypothetical protein n=1 Tax=Scatolibacter rhodanostii TaxID=2014781 RepID=UPI00117D24EA|nr:hypothetical protein [Scatolibacter rhodanostii]
MSTGRVTSSDKEQITVQAELEYRLPKMVAPYGVASVPPEGEQGIIMNGCCMGVQTDTTELQPGEIRLRSAAGAEIWLKNNGDVWINGQRFAAKEA